MSASDTTLPRVWGLPVRHAAIAGVIARFPTDGKKRWTCVLKWNLSNHELEEGAWTLLHLKEQVCRISDDGEFLHYVAYGPLGGPFSRMFGGGAAVSRLPWLSALTDIIPACVAGGGPSKHALDVGSQQQLWKMFEDAPLYNKPQDWPEQFGPAWKRVDAALYSIERIPRQRENRRVRRVAVAPLEGRDLRLVLLVDRIRGSDGVSDSPRFFIETLDGAGSLQELQGLRWAHPAPRGGIAAATIDGRVQLLYPKLKGVPDTPLRIDFERDLKTLRPKQQPSPPRARRPLRSTPREGKQR